MDTRRHGAMRVRRRVRKDLRASEGQAIDSSAARNSAGSVFLWILTNLWGEILFLGFLFWYL